MTAVAEHDHKHDEESGTESEDEHFPDEEIDAATKEAQSKVNLLLNLLRLKLLIILDDNDVDLNYKLPYTCITNSLLKRPVFLRSW